MPDKGSIRLGSQELAGAAGLEGCARRHCADLSDDQAVRDHERSRQRAGRARGAAGSAGMLSGCRHQGRAPGGGGPDCVRRLSGCAGDAGGRSAACRPPPGRDRARACDASARAAAGRAGRRADARRQGGAEQAAAPHRRSRHRGDPGRARHDDGHGHLASRRRARCRHVHRDRDAGRSPAQPGSDQGLSWRRKCTGRPRPAAWNGSRDPVLAAIKVSAGYGAAPVLDNVSLEVRPGETVAHDRRQWRGQIHHHAHAVGPAAAGQRRHPVERPEHRPP